VEVDGKMNDGNVALVEEAVVEHGSNAVEVDDMPKDGSVVLVEEEVVEHGSCSVSAAVVDTNMSPLVDE